MKKHTLGFLVALVAILTLVINLIFSAVVEAGLAHAKKAKKEVIAPPSGAFERQLLVYEGADTVIYKVTKEEVFADFTADHSGKLLSLRLVIGDSKVYEWDLVYCDDGKVKTWGEDGQHLDNQVTVDTEKWLKFFREKLVTKVEFHSDRTLFEFEGIEEWEFAGYGESLSVVIKSSKGVLKTIPDHEIFLPFPKTGKFFLGSRCGMFFPVLRTPEGSGVIPITK